MFRDYQLLCHLYGLSGASGILKTEYAIPYESICWRGINVGGLAVER